jgi:hypothetical protein
MPKVQKIPSLRMLLKTNIKFTALIGPPISQYARVGCLPTSPAGYINRRVGEKLPQHSLLLHRCAVENLY